MGNKASEISEIKPEEMYEAVKFVMLHQGMNFTQSELQKPISIILSDMQQHHPFKQTDNNQLCVNNYLIRMFYCQYFTKQLLKLLKHFMEKLQQINKQSFIFLKNSDINYLTMISNFILFSSNENILALFDSLLVRSDIDVSNRETLKEIQSRDDQVEICENLVEKMASEEIQAVEKTLRVTLLNFIELRQQAISRSEQTLQYLSYLEQSLFMLYTKIYFSEPQLYRADGLHSDGSRQKQHFKKNMILGAYFLASGSSTIKPSVFQTSILFLQSLMNLIKADNFHPELKTLPSHLFKNLPVVPSNSLYDYIICNILYCLKYIKQGPSNYIRFSCNRIQALKLVEKMLAELKLQNQTITYYLEQLCLQVKIGQIERACLQKISKIYFQTLNLNQKTSQILKKFIDSSDLKYNLKFAGRQIKVSAVELLTQLEEGDDMFAKEYGFYNEKYIYENIISQEMQYTFDDRLLWNEILPSIIENKEDEQVRRKSENKISDDEEYMENSSKMMEEKQIQKSENVPESQDQLK